MAARRINIHSLKTRLITWIMVVFMLFALAFSMLTFFTNGWIIDKITESTVANVEQTNHFISFIFQKAKEIGFIVSTNEDLVSIVNFNEALAASYYEKYALVDRFIWEIMMQAEMNQEVSAIYAFIEPKHELMTSDMEVYSSQFFPDDVAWLHHIDEIDSRRG